MLSQSIENCLTLSTTDIKHHLKYSGDVLNEGLQWSVSGKIILKVSYSILVQDEARKELHLNYWSPIKGQIFYVIPLIAIPTNIGGGKRWYFLCPKTKKRCFKLILPRGEIYFLHRTAFPHILYRKQQFSRKGWAIQRLWELLFEESKLNEEIHEPYRKKHYRGKPTPLMRKIIKQKSKDLNFDLVACEQIICGRYYPLAQMSAIDYRENRD
jgi:hypothetical protein